MGGMGPQASLDLHGRILERASALGARSGGDYPEMVHVSLPVDDEYFLSDRAKAEQAQRAVVEALECIQPSQNDKVVLACNTIHLIAPDIEQRLNIKCLSLIEHTVDAAEARGLKSIGLLGSPMTIQTKIYETPLGVKGIEVIVPSQAQIAMIEAAIRGVIAGQPTAPLRRKLRPIIRTLEHQGAQAIVLGCTELSVLFGDETDGYLDPLDIIKGKLMEEN